MNSNELQYCRPDPKFATERGIEQDANYISLVLSKDKSVAQVSISEYPSETAAKSPFGMPISQGIIRDCKDPECGDEGQKIYSDKGFEYQMFRKGRFLVYIHSDSEETAKRFAGYAIEAINKR